MFRNLQRLADQVEKGAKDAAGTVLGTKRREERERRRRAQEERQRQQQRRQAERLAAAQRRFEEAQARQAARMEEARRRHEEAQRRHAERMAETERRMEANRRMLEERTRLAEERAEAQRRAQEERAEAERERLRAEAEAARAREEEARARAEAAERERREEEERAEAAEAAKAAEAAAAEAAARQKEEAERLEAERREAEAFEAEAAEIAAVMHEAMDGIGTDEAQLTGAVCSLSDAQAARVAAHFKAEHGRDLLDELRSECSGNYRTLLLGVFQPKAFIDAQMVKDACAGLGTDERLLTQALLLSSDDEIRAASRAFADAFGGKDMAAEVRSDVGGRLGGKYGQLVLSVLAAALGDDGRDSGEEEEGSVETDVMRLHNAAEGMGVQSKPFVEVFSKSREHLARVFDAYPRRHGTSLKKLIEDEFSGDMRYALLALLTPRHVHVAETLHDAMKGVGADGKTIARQLIRARGDTLRAASRHFVRAYDGSIAHWLEREHSIGGDFRAACIALCKAYEE